jgi:fructokinase
MTAPLQLFGEVLFDRFPDGRSVLGGAPFNVAWHLQAFGEAPRLVSRVGDDADGQAVRAAMVDWGMDLSGLQTDADLPTGRVEVSIVDGEPSYDIVHPVAWDAIREPTNGAAGRDADAWLYHGSLALRDARSRAALERLAGSSGGRVFLDVNLREPWWNPAGVRERLENADWAKLNADELERLAPQADSLMERADALLREAGLEGLIVTRGSTGALVAEAGGAVHQAPAPAAATIVDTVGAGDAFASVMILGLRRGWSLATTLDRALAFAAAVCGLRGATVADPAFYRPWLDAWGLTDKDPH